MAGGLYVIAAGDTVWASMDDQAVIALNQGFVLDQTASNATGALTTNATFASGTTFTVTGDQTSFYVVGRRIRVVSAAGTSYGRILSSVFSSPNTTVTIGDITSGPTVMTTPITSVALSLVFAGAAGNEASMADRVMLSAWSL